MKTRLNDVSISTGEANFGSIINDWEIESNSTTIADEMPIPDGPKGTTSRLTVSPVCN